MAGRLSGALWTTMVQFAAWPRRAAELDQGAAERDARGEIAGVIGEAGAADADGFVVVAGAAALLGELRKSNRRRVRLDPASQFEDSWIVGRHAVQFTARSSR